MNHHSNIWQSARLMFLCLPLTLLSMGCLERKETIKVQPDGAVAIELNFKGDNGELDGPFALPTASNGWRVERHEVSKHVQLSKDDDRKGEEIVSDELLEATANFDAGEALPSTFGDGSDVYLRFPTTVRREEKKDGVYLIFTRHYEMRPYAFIAGWQKLYVDDPMKRNENEDKEFKDLSRDKKKSVLSGFAKFEAEKHIELLKLATQIENIELSQVAWLASSGAIRSVFNKFLDKHLEKLLDELEEQQADAKLQEIGESLPRQAMAACFVAMREQAELSSTQVMRIKKAYQKESIRFDITNALRGHTFSIELNMPGEVVAHNAMLAEDGRLAWSFTGEFLCDRTVELMAVSKLPHTSDR